jgi:Predicted amino acid racemase
MAYPRLLIHTGKILENAKQVVARAATAGIDVAGVTKGMCADPEIARAMLDGGCRWLADSRVSNLRRLRQAGIGAPLMLLRIPMLSELSSLIEYADLTLVSMPDTVLALESACSALGKTVGALVMVDTGDLREGLWPDETGPMARTLSACRWVHPVGVGTNLGCFGGVLPTEENMALLLAAAGRLSSGLPSPVGIVSGGGTSSLMLVEENRMPPGINQLRVGEAILLGRDVTRLRTIPYLQQDTMVLEAEIVEVRTKPSVPIGTIGADAFGNVPHFEDRGKRLRAIVAIGRQDARLEGLTPLDAGVHILGASSDHLTIDVEECLVKPRVGNRVRFSLDYGAMLSLATSGYVEKIHV